MRKKSVSNQPAKLYGTVKTRKFENLNDITLQNNKCGPIIDQTANLHINLPKSFTIT